MDIVAAYGEVGTFRGAAQMCGTTHKTVARVIERHRAGGVPGPRKERARNYESVEGLVAKRVEVSKGRISAKRLLPIAQAEGYAGSARNFRRLVAAAKAQWRRENHRGRRPAVWTPGEYLVIDWTDVGEGLHVFSAVLAWSRFRFARFAADERSTTTFAFIAEALAEIGGVPGKVLADRMGCLKGGIVANVVVPTPAYVRFATHYGFAPDWCHANDPASKGIVENLVGYSQRDLAVPLLTEARLTGRRLDVHAANTAARAWCAEVNATVHSEICAVPADRLIQERELLAVLPSLRLNVGPEPVTRKVDRLSCVRFASARYSVPTRLIGASVIVQVEGARLIVVDPGTGQVVAEHGLAAPGEASVADEHYDGPRPAPNRGPRPRTVAEQRFCALGPDAEAFLVGAAASGNTRLGPELDVLLALEAAHGPGPLVAALHRAVAFKRWRAGDVRSILAAGLGTQDPRPAGDALVLDLPRAAPRSLDDYTFTALDLTTPPADDLPDPDAAAVEEVAP
jgi:transposase